MDSTNNTLEITYNHLTLVIDQRFNLSACTTDYIEVEFEK
ncbi:hypothetical protein C427_5062 [Paraglaciecola psychrophila 170]|uniref:Uncharacterized protein n=1 Tax=Paraglaciecola psychrophila 170 TaxID=1129794 RepID=M4RUC2_9ALTE|nr:hypothetical protein C427_5062 [Paraglaciecola psychrophila 170]